MKEQRTASDDNGEPDVRKTYLELLREYHVLEQRVAEARQRALGDALALIVRTMTEYDIDLSQIRHAMPKGKLRKRSRKAAVKYMDPVSGRTWTGRGRPPAWMKNKDPDEFLLT
ncbi:MULTISPECIES: H-NS histone family protein [Pseudomonadota]|uniref:H-NS histone family protein n=1 Tax=Pseudomonadota TaxID=1224 RepID=UPI0008B05EC6|nr:MULTISPECIES: H-NS histone family protein [Pseudomonadota]MBJ9965609.1 H-NS histone family protein [Burkholderia seminalis]MDN7586822.1 H-NS histone family protein [Burkholderia seminalis]OFU89056.1 hypothetical protein HMPREF3114_18480 [Stenotrophomonas sp. HMSC10F07]